MKTSIKKYIAALAMTPLLFSSCSESFLEEVNPSEATTETYWLSEENVTKGLAATYNPIRRMTSGYFGGFDGILHLQMRADDLFPTRGEEPNPWAVLSFTNTPNTSVNCWGNLYTIIQLANEFIYSAPNATEMDQNKLSQMLGEAHFLRGFAYFHVRLNYNEGVLRTLPQHADPDERGLSSPEDLMNQAITDFKEAKERLPKSRPQSENGRITQGAAIAMLGKAYIWTNDYAAAKAEFETIMNGSYGYDLEEEYENNFRDDHEFNKESIWEINYEAFGDEGDAWGNGTGSNAFMGNVLAHYFGPALPNNTEDKENPGSCKGGGWYKMQPSPFLIKQFISEPRPTGSDSKWDKRLYTTSFFKYSDYNDVKADDKFYDNFDFYDFFELATKDKWAKGIPAYPDIEGKPGRFLMKKFACWWNPEGCTMYHNNNARINNFRIMRFAEVLFLHAEACLQTGDVASAMNDINRIRQRAGLPAKQIGDSSAAMEELRNQKLLEFAGENIRWYDLVRWYSFEDLKSMMMERKKDTKQGNSIVDTQNFSKMEKKHLYFPIPQSEVDSNSAMEQKADWK